jgi:Flp pilus assembly protein TadG
MSRRAGQGLVEFSLIAVMMVLMLLFVVEISRMVLVYTTVANAARAGTRYAIVHGGSRAAGSTVDSASGPAADPAQVLTVVKNFAGAGLLRSGLLVVHATYPGASNAPGQKVIVTAVYPYDPLTTYFSKTLRLGSTSQGVIVF